ncbi:MAG TPA: hypothetical protein VF540_05505, partial [Segetibacter sp.]
LGKVYNRTSFFTFNYRLLFRYPIFTSAPKLKKLKKVLFSVIMIAAASCTQSQEILIKVNQSASAYKNSNMSKFADAEVNDIEATVVVQNSTVLVEGNTKASYTLNKKRAQTRRHDNVISYHYDGKDDKNTPISFLYTVNLHSKEAVVEVATNRVKTFYFGTYSSLDLTHQR